MSIKNSFENKFGARVSFEEPLAPFLAYGIGGPAEILVFPKDEEELSWISSFAKKHQLPITIIGSGTNLLVVDEGLRGIVLSLHKAFKEIEFLQNSTNEQVLIRCGGGVEKQTLLNWAIENHLSGLEFSAGVPGTIGGGIFMNAGTKYGCYGDILKEIRLFDFNDGGKTVYRKDFHFGYREQSLVGKNLVVSTLFELKKTDQISEVKKEVERIIAERREKQPLDYPSCGSTFKNPEGLSAGRLIEKTGLKGLQIGGAQISTKHANFLLNRGNAKAKDILELIDIIKAKVKEQSGIELQCEVIILGARQR